MGWIMIKDTIYELYKSHKGEVIGAAIGALFAIFIIIIGFWKTIFIAICTFIGYFIGKKISSTDKLIEILDKILPQDKF